MEISSLAEKRFFRICKIFLSLWCVLRIMRAMKIMEINIKLFTQFTVILSARIEVIELNRTSAEKLCAEIESSS